MAAFKLNPHESEVKEFFAGGKSTQEVANKLLLSPTTVRVHISAIRREPRAKVRGNVFPC